MSFFKGGSLIFNRSNNTTFGGDISGFGQLQQIGGGTLTLTGVNSYSGPTTVSAGTLQAGSATALSSNSAFTVNAFLDLNCTPRGRLTCRGGTVTNNGGSPATLTAGGDNSSTTVAPLSTDLTALD